METGKILTFTDNDLRLPIDVKKVWYCDFEILDFETESMKQLHEAEFIRYVDSKGNMKILKDRYGKNGITLRTIKDNWISKLLIKLNLI